MVRIVSSFFHQQSDIDFSENMQFKLHFFFPMEKVYLYEYISVNIVTPARRLLVGLWRLEFCAILNPQYTLGSFIAESGRSFLQLLNNSKRSFFSWSSNSVVTKQLTIEIVSSFCLQIAPLWMINIDQEKTSYLST